MLTNLGRLVNDRLVDQVVGVEIWNKRQAQESALPSVVFDIQLGPRVAGTAEIAPMLLIANCYDATSDGVEAVAKAVVEALQGWSAWDDDVSILNCEQTNAVQDFDDEKKVFYAVLSFSATAVL